MSEMNQFLAEYYGTAGQATMDEETKTAEAAQMELFAKMAAAEGIDLESMTDAQVEQLYANTFSKEASPGTEKDAEEEEDKGEDDKKEKAEKEHEEKKAEAEKVAEADFLGRVMAHAYVNELNKIASAQGEEQEKVAKGGFPFGKAIKGFGKKVDKGVESAKKSVGKAIDKGSDKVKEKADQVHSFAKKHPGKTLAAGAGAGAAAGFAGGRASKNKEVTASAIDELAYGKAVEKAAAAGWDSDEAATRLAALQILGASEEGSKVASASNVDEAVDIRAAELLELTGYPISWE